MQCFIFFKHSVMNSKSLSCFSSTQGIWKIFVQALSSSVIRKNGEFQNEAKHIEFSGGGPRIFLPPYTHFGVLCFPPFWNLLLCLMIDEFAVLQMRFSEEQPNFYIWFVYAFRCSGVKFHGEYLCHLLYRNCFSVNPFVPNASFIYPLKKLGANGLRGYC